jgi:hypothetical protein
MLNFTCGIHSEDIRAGSQQLLYYFRISLRTFSINLCTVADPDDYIRI